MAQSAESKKRKAKTAAAIDDGRQAQSDQLSDDQSLISSVAELDEELSLEIAARLIGRRPARDILNLALEGLKIVGQRFESGEYFVSGLVMAGEIMRRIMQLVSGDSPITMTKNGSAGVIVLGTVEGDIHDLGKDLVKQVLTANSFEVHDLGVDVAPEVFLAETIRCQPDLVGISILISSSFPYLSKTISQLRDLIPAGFKKPGIIIGGGAVDDLLFKHTKADLWCRELMTMGDACRDWIARQNAPQSSFLPLRGKG